MAFKRIGEDKIILLWARFRVSLFQFVLSCHCCHTLFLQIFLQDNFLCKLISLSQIVLANQFNQYLRQITIFRCMLQSLMISNFLFGLHYSMPIQFKLPVWNGRCFVFEIYLLLASECNGYSEKNECFFNLFLCLHLLRYTES